MKRLTLYLEQIFDYLLLSIILVVSLVLVIPFTFAFALVVSYFNTPLDSRSIKGAFITLKANLKMFTLYSIVTTLIITLLTLNIYFFGANTSGFNIVILFLSWIFLVFAVTFALFAPIIILKMNITFKQLLQNSILLALRGHIFTILLLALTFGLTYLAIIYPLAIIPLLYFYGYLIYLTTNKILEEVKKGGLYAHQE